MEMTFDDLLVTPDDVRAELIDWLTFADKSWRRSAFTRRCGGRALWDSVIDDMIAKGIVVQTYARYDGQPLIAWAKK